MTHFSENPGMVRVEYFKDSGKWYMTEAIDMSEWYFEPMVQNAVRKALDASRPERPSGWWSSFNIVVLEPYHEHGIPVMLKATA